MSLTEEKRRAFNQQMNAWSSRQGIWFQLRNLGDGQNIVPKLLRLSLFFGAIVFILALVGAFFLYQRVETESFRESVSQRLLDVFKASSAKVTAIKKDKGKVMVRLITLEGTEASFFHTSKIRNLTFDMQPLDGIIGKWDVGVLSASALELNVKSGDTTAANALNSFQALFPKYGNFNFSRLEINNVDLSWGYSVVNKGSIKGSKLIAHRDEKGWDLEFTGGVFSHHWLRDLNIERIEAVCDSTGIHITNAKLVDGDGSIDFTLDLTIGVQPKASGLFTIKSLPLKGLLPDKYQEFVAGSISAEGYISGALNSRNGVICDADIQCDESSPLIIMDAVPLQDILSIVDLNRSYHKLKFIDGGFHLNVTGDQASYSKIKLKSSVGFGLVGEFLVRPPTYEEVADTLELDVELVRTTIQGDDQFFQEDDKKKKSLKEAPEVIELRKESIDQELLISRYIGDLKIQLMPDVFSNKVTLQKAYPVKEDSGRVELNLSLRSSLSLLTKEVSAELHKLGKSRL